MICPNCGTENSVEIRFCRVCKIELRSALPTIQAPFQHTISTTTFDSWVAELIEDDLIDPEPERAISIEVIPNTEFGQNETVFVPTAETADDPVRQGEINRTPNIEFEDEEADDFFEQSLSGLRISDLEEEEAETSGAETVEPQDLDEPVNPEPEIPETIVAAEPPVMPETLQAVDMEPDPAEPEVFESQVPLLEIPEAESFLPELIAEPPHLQEPWIPGTGQVTIREIKVAPTFTGPAARRKRRWPRVILRSLGVLLGAAIFFGSGLATGVWLLGVPQSQIARQDEVDVVAEKPKANVPPSGMAYVPGGEFQMGSDTEDVLSRPEHRASVGPFFIDVTEVTNEAYLEFVNTADQKPPVKWKDGAFSEGESKLPVTGVSWYDAVEYCMWTGKRLPTEAEWEFAARGTDGRLYPWGNDWNAASANAANNSKGLRSVGEGAISPFGLYDMAGNAWEWTKSDAKSYPGGKEFPWSRLKLKIIRGGSWQSSPKTATSVFRGFYGASGEREYDGTGFRCVKDVPRD